MMMQGAALGAGAAVGSSMVHGAMGMMSGGSKTEVQQQQAYREQQPTTTIANQQQFTCGNELKQFMNCTQSYANDLTICQAFNDVYRQCKSGSAASV